MDPITTALERFIVDELMMADKNTKIDPDSSLLASGVVDSLGLVRLISFVEDQFKVRIEDSEVVPENFESINVIKSLIESKQTIVPGDA